MSKYFIFSILTILVTIISWRTLFNVKSHGFYRYFSWVSIIWLMVSNYHGWFAKPQSIYQVISIVFMLVSGFLIYRGFTQMTRLGKIKRDKERKTLFEFEQTTELVDKGVFSRIRHPFYSSLLFLTWGLFLRNFSLDLLVAAIISTVFIYLTARFDEKECIAYFGDKYKDYMKRTKMFIPFVF